MNPSNAATTPSLGEDFETVADALNNNAHGPLCEFGQCPACEALDALREIATNGAEVRKDTVQAFARAALLNLGEQP